MAASLLTNLVNIEYLTGFHSSNAYLLRLGRNNYLFTDGRYLEKANKLAKLNKSRIGKFQVMDMGNDFKGTLQKLLKKHKIKTLEFEGNHMTVNQHKRFKSMTKGLKWEDGATDAWSKRAQKEPSEIRKLKRSQEINEQIFYAIRAELKTGITELEIGQLVKQFCPKFGADDISFEPIIAFGNHSSMPHHQNTTRKLKKGDPVLIDMGVNYQGYASDMTRMVFTKSPTPKQEKIYNLVLTAQEAGIKAMKPRVKASTPDEAAHKALGDHDQYFTHSLGHGIGLEVHEPPSLSKRSSQTLKAGMVVTSEPGIYLPGEFGVRIEDMILITKSGHQNLTKVPKAIKDCILR
jgi:Xaa-Pro aminopeptidase